MAYLRQNNHLAATHGIRSVVRMETLFVLPPLEPRESDAATGTLSGLHALATNAPGIRRLARSMMAYFAAFCDSSAPQGATTHFTLFRRGRNVRSDGHSPTSRPALNSPTTQS